MTHIALEQSTASSVVLKSTKYFMLFFRIVPASEFKIITIKFKTVLSVTTSASFFASVPGFVV
jgi:hypothetical protein